MCYLCKKHTKDLCEWCENTNFADLKPMDKVFIAIDKPQLRAQCLPKYVWTHI